MRHNQENRTLNRYEDHMSDEGRLLAGIVDAVLALYGRPVPYGGQGLNDLAEELHALAADKRYESEREDPR